MRRALTTLLMRKGLQLGGKKLFPDSILWIYFLFKIFLLVA